MIGISAGILLIPLIITVIVYVICRAIKKPKLPGTLFWCDITFIIYCFIAVGLLFFPVEIYYDSYYSEIIINLVPFKDVWNIINGSLSRQAVTHIIAYLAGNLLIFVPLAFYLRFRYEKDSRRRFVLLVVLSASAEILQLLIVLLTRNTARIIDITDLILNLGGSLFAWYVFGIFKESHKRKNELREKTEKQ
ncbi:MAG: VanZ family protein [Clostridiales bacterium]|nr:VanZ family protein [Clostridiales bacterium]